MPVWCQDEAGPYQVIPQPGASWQPEGQPARQPHEYIRGGTAKLLTLFRPATGEVQGKGVVQATNAVLHPWLQEELEQVLAGQFDAPYRLKDALAPVLKEFDYIVLDTPPSLGILTVNALVASTHLIVPIQAAYFAIEGTDDLLETYERIRMRPNPGLKMLGVVITLFDKRTNIARDTHGQIRTVFGETLFKTKISKNVRLEESPAYKETILTFAPKSPGAIEYKKLAGEVIQRVEEDRITRHAEDAA